MPAIAYKKVVKRRRRRRLIPRRRLFKVKSLIPRRTIYIHHGRFQIFKHRTPRARMFRRFNTYILPTAPTKSYSQPYKKKAKKDWSAEKKKYTKVWQSPAYKKLYTPKGTSGFPKELGQWYKDVFEKEWLKRGMGPKKKPTPPKAKTYKNWGGKREYVWKGENYGVKKALGPKLIFEVIPTREYYFYKRLRTGEGDRARIEKNINRAMQDVLDGLLGYTKKVINKYVPKDTGDLRKTMIESIKKSKVHALRMKVELDTGDLYYANWVNNMPESKIRHDKRLRRIGGKMKLLHDPKAIEGWFEHISMLLNEEAGKLLREMVKEILSIWSVRVYKQKPTLKKGDKAYRYPRRTKQQYEYYGHSQRSTSSNYITPKERALAKKQRGSWHTRRHIKGVTLLRERSDSPMTPREEDEHERDRHVRMMEYHKDFKKAYKESSITEYPRWMIRGMFKIKGLYKGNRVG